MSKSIVLCIIGLFFYNPILCAYFNDHGGVHHELTKNQIDHVQISNDNVPKITAELLWELVTVKNLEIKYCNVRSLEPGAFNRLKSLKKLNLRYNLLEEIKYGVFNDSGIEELDLSNNNIRTIEEKAFRHMWGLEILKLKNNKLKVFNNLWFEGNPSLVSVSFENNLIESLPGDIFNTDFFLNDNFDFFFSHNKIQEVDENVFKHIWRINKLYLDHNDIETIKNETFSPVVKINDLRLDHNKIVCTTPNIKMVEKFSVDENPWNQQCLRALLEQKMNKPTSTVRSFKIQSPYSPFIRIG